MWNHVKEEIEPRGGVHLSRWIESWTHTGHLEEGLKISCCNRVLCLALCGLMEESSWELQHTPLKGGNIHYISPSSSKSHYTDLVMGFIHFATPNCQTLNISEKPMLEFQEKPKHQTCWSHNLLVSAEYRHTMLPQPSRPSSSPQELPFRRDHPPWDHWGIHRSVRPWEKMRK